MSNFQYVCKKNHACCLTPCDKYFIHIQEENKFNNIYKLYRNKGMMGQPRETTVDCHLKSMEIWIGTKILTYSWVGTTILTYSWVGTKILTYSWVGTKILTYSFSKSTKLSLTCSGRDEHITHYAPPIVIRF